MRSHQSNRLSVNVNRRGKKEKKERKKRKKGGRILEDKMRVASLKTHLAKISKKGNNNS